MVYLCFQKSIVEGNEGSIKQKITPPTTTTTTTTTTTNSNSLQVKLSDKEKKNNKFTVKLNDKEKQFHRFTVKLNDNDNSGGSKSKSKSKSKGSIKHKKKHLISGEAEIARRNFKLCADTDQYHSCDVKYRKPPPIYINPPAPKKLDPSNIYNKLSICPETYQTNMDLLRGKKSVGQYSGYSENGYIDRIRYIKPIKGGVPLPVNPDFFMNGGGTYA